MPGPDLDAAGPTAGVAARCRAGRGVPGGVRRRAGAARRRGLLRTGSALGDHRAVRIGQVVAAASVRRAAAAPRPATWRSTVATSPAYGPGSGAGYVGAGSASCSRIRPTTSSPTSARGEQVELAARIRGADVAEAPVLLDAVGLAGRHHCFPAELSGGEQQRVAFAAGAIGLPTLLLADEPTAELDAAAAATLVEIMRELVSRGATLVVASHDAAVVSAADHLVQLRDGRVVRDGRGRPARARR